MVDMQSRLADDLNESSDKSEAVIDQIKGSWFLV